MKRVREPEISPKCSRDLCEDCDGWAGEVTDAEGKTLGEKRHCIHGCHNSFRKVMTRKADVSGCGSKPALEVGPQPTPVKKRAIGTRL